MSSLPPYTAPSNPVLRPPGSPDHLLLRVEKLSKSYGLAPGQDAAQTARTAVRRLELFNELTFSVPRGQILAIVGQSGVGKSTLLHLLGALDRPTSGEIWCNHIQLGSLTGEAAARFRNREAGYVWQFHYLLPEFTAAENVAMPLLARGLGSKPAAKLAAEWLDRVGLGDRLHHRSGELSGGEQQRVSLARALITQPKLLLADEPTGDLDGSTANAIFLLLEELHRQEALTTVLVTHNMTLAGRCHRVLRLTRSGMTEVSAAELVPSIE